MSESPGSQNEIFYDAFGKKESEKADNFTSEETSFASVQAGAGDLDVQYFELEKEKDDDVFVEQGKDDDSDPLYRVKETSKEGSNKVTKRYSFRKLNNIVKSKVDALGKTKMFGGKKKGDKHEKDAKKEEAASDAKKKGAKVKASPEILYDTPKSQNMLSAGGTEGGAMPVLEGGSASDVSLVASSVPSVKSGGSPGANTPTKHDGNRPECGTSQDNAPDSVYQMAKPIPPESNDIKLDTNSCEHLGTYDVPIFPQNETPSTTKANNEKEGKKTAAINKNLHYMSAKVPVMIDPSSPRMETESLKSSVSMSVNRGCLEGVGEAVPVDFIHPLESSGKAEEEASEYNRLYFQSTKAKLSANRKQRMKERGYDTLASIGSAVSQDSLEKFEQELGGFDSEDNPSEEDEEDLSFDWGSEFDEESYQEGVEELLLSEIAGHDKDEAPDKPLPPKPGKGKRTGKVAPLDLHEASSVVCLPVTINPEKHPPPVLPPVPNDLTENQRKRRLIVDQIISSERSYLESLERLVKDYERTVLEFIPHAKSHLRPVFAAMREIISHHKMFQIELAETARQWDEKEMIGDIFTASFSKTMLVNAYSIYVNNFAAAMEEIRSLQRSRQAFDDFLNKQGRLSPDRLSIFGLMVKPVQRFPQFIMFLQDLIKNTSQDHHDRRALQLAMTELENVAYKLNERKRQSEQKFQAQQAVQQLIRQKVQHMLTTWNLDMDSKRRLIRGDEVEQVYGDFGSMKCKDRRLILMNDLVLCVKVIQKEQSGFSVERLALRWIAKVKDLELKDTAVTPNMQSVITKDTGKIHIMSSKLEKPEEDPFHLYADLQEMLHDYTVLGNISGLLSTLKRSYTGHGLREELIHEVLRDLQRMIQIKDEQLHLVNSCSIILEDTSKPDKPHYVLQTQTAAIKQDWCVDFLMAKLALDKSNILAWDGPRDSDDIDFDVIPAHFVKHLPVDVPRNYTKVRCAVSIFLSPENSTAGIGIQHLWVCSSTSNHGQVSVLSIHNSKPALMESFKACSCDIMSAELIPGCGASTNAEHYLFAEDTVWVTNAHNEILIFPLTGDQGGVRHDPLSVIRSPAVVTAVKFVDERVFCGYDDGALAVYSRNSDGSWSIPDPVSLSFGVSPVKIHFVHEEDIWLSCANKLCLLEIDSLKTKAIHVLSSCNESAIENVVKSGVGIWVSFKDNAYIKLFHIESMEGLQEISVGNFVNRIRSEKLWTLSKDTENLVVTTLAASKGLLWIGTSLGVVLTVPLPRLSDGVPLYRGRPSISLHAHRGPVKFLIPMQCSSSILELNRSSSLRSTIRSRQSRRNLERERIELEESVKRRNKATNFGEASVPQDDAEKKPDGTNLEEATVALQDKKNHSSVDSPVQEDGGTAGKVDVLTSPSPCGNKLSVERQSSIDQNESQRSLDDTSILLRSKSKGAVVERKSKTLSFRSELAQRIIGQTESVSQFDLDLIDTEPHEVEVLYEVLLEDDPDRGSGGTLGNANNASNSGIRRKSSKFENSSKTSSNTVDSGHAKPSWLNPSASGNSQSKNVKEQQQPAAKKPGPLSLVVPSVSPSISSASSSSAGSQRDNTSDISPSVSRQSAAVRSLQRTGTTKLTTTRKVTSNAVIVVSGGDGYCDLDMSRNQTKADDAAILLWIYKF